MTPSPLPTASAAATTAANQDMFGYLMPLMFLLAGLYMIWRAIVPGGKTFEFAQYKQEIRPHAVKTMRIFFAVAGPVCLAEAALDYLATNMGMKQLLIYEYIALGLAVALVVAYIIYTVRKYGKYRINP